MFDQISAALRARSSLRGWSVKHTHQRGWQLYAVPGGVEAVRETSQDTYKIEVLIDTGTADQPACGEASVTVLPGDDIDHTIDEALLMASLVHNPLYDLPGPAPLPNVPLADAALQRDPAGVLNQLYARLSAAVARHPQVRMTAAEVFADQTTTHFVNSRGIDAEQTGTTFAIEWVLIGRAGEREVETFFETTRRRVEDLDVEAEVERRVQYTLDLLTATAPTDYVGPVVLQGGVLANFFSGAGGLGGDVFAQHGSAESKYAKVSQWEIGQSIFKREVDGDSLTLWANRTVPYGVHSDRFDDEGLPAQRLELIRDGRLTALVASQRYAEYLELPATGAFGNFEVAAGPTPLDRLLAEPHIEIVSFSWFNPSPITGDFTCEIRLGYMVANGQRTPFRGGTLIGNVLDALASVQFSAETGFYGDYAGPIAARFKQLKVAGHTA